MGLNQAIALINLQTSGLRRNLAEAGERAAVSNALFFGSILVMGLKYRDANYGGLAGTIQVIAQQIETGRVARWAR